MKRKETCRLRALNTRAFPNITNTAFLRTTSYGAEALIDADTTN